MLRFFGFRKQRTRVCVTRESALDAYYRGCGAGLSKKRIIPPGLTDPHVPYWMQGFMAGCGAAFE